jgi:hypoxanthine phosphoribosyltransferase
MILETVQYSWQEYHTDMRKLKKLVNYMSFDCVLGIARGGLVPAVELSNYFDIPLIPLRFSTRDFKFQDNLDALIGVTDGGLVRYNYILIVDDMIDSGKTMKELISNIDTYIGCQYKILTLWNNIRSEIQPDVWARNIDRERDKRWIVYPWE